MAVHFSTFSHAQTIDRTVWNELAEGASPMMEWEYFYSLEQSEAVSIERGYRPCHLLAYSDRRPVALAPLYERDRAWVEFGDGGLVEFLSQLTGIPYHRGLVGTIPFTPVPGYQFLHHPSIDTKKAHAMLLNYIDYLCETKGLLTSRIYFVSLDAPELHRALEEQGYVGLRSQYCLWINREYRQFEDYLSSFKSSRRTKIKRELRTIGEQGVRIRMIPGAEAPEAYYDQMFDLYLRTWTKYMGYGTPPFLNADFFKLLSEHFRKRTSFSVATQAEKKIAMAIFYEKAETLYGRYWGSFEELPFLHFATCYYLPIEYAIHKGIRVMDPGFGGEHKLIRGYEVVPVYHYIKFYGEKQRQVAASILDQMRKRQAAGQVNL